MEPQGLCQDKSLPYNGLKTQLSLHMKQCISVSRDLPPTGSEANTTQKNVHLSPEIFCSKNVGNSIKREENMKLELFFCICFGHLPFNFMLKFPIYHLKKLPPI